MRFTNYLISRIITYFVVIFISMTFVFLIPRFSPIDPVAALIGRLTAQGSFMEASALDAMQKSLKETFGLEGSVFEQYIKFWKRILLGGDFGPSYAMFPTSVNQLIRESLPWTIWLLSLTTIISWFIGNIIGAITGFRKDKWYSKLLENIAMIIRPIPYYIVALILILLLTYIFPVFSMTAGGSSIGIKPSFSWIFIKDALKTAFLPALSLVIVGFGWWFLSMDALSRATTEEEFVSFAEIKGLTENEIMFRYVMKNAMLPQVTALALSIGSIFNGALMTEIMFSYPGIGMLLYRAITSADFNLMMGIITISVFAVATACLIVDLFYPFIDPRIRYR